MASLFGKGATRGSSKPDLHAARGGPEPMAHERSMPGQTAGGGHGETTIEHHPPGMKHPETGEPIAHTVHHADGEESHHPSMAHAATHMAAKHDGGEHGHIHSHEEGATTHHAGLDGETTSAEHPSVEEGMEHMGGEMGGEMPESEGYEGGEPEHEFGGM